MSPSSTPAAVLPGGSISADASSSAEPVLLIIADISGYTRYMAANAKTLAHSQTIITELVTAIVREVELPLEVAKLEGDAVFLFCRKTAGAVPWEEARRLIGTRVLRFFQLFTGKVRELSQSTTCSCSACTHIERLRLKVVIHSGEALIHQVLHFRELAGVDVIIVHRLLKNSVTADQYLLMTEAARDDVQFPETVRLSRGSEQYGELGTINTLTYLPDGAAAPEPPASQAPSSLGQRVGRSGGLFWKLWFSPLTKSSGTQQHAYRNLAPGTGAAHRTALAFFTVVATPLFVPVGLLMAFVHAVRAPKIGGPPGNHPEHQHNADGSCCRRS